MPIFVHRIFTYTPSKPRHPLLRLMLGLLGVMLLGLLVVFGLFIGLGMLLFAAARRMFRPAVQAAAPEKLDGVIDGEFSVIDKNRASLSLR